MTHEQWIKLTPEEQRIRVAELRGWIVARNEDHVGWCGTTTLIGYWPPTIGLMPIPDYLNDLNAMRSAEESSTIFESWRDTERWMNNLSIAVLGRPCYSEPDRAFVLRATAAQRAEAFVMTMTGGKE